MYADQPARDLASRQHERALKRARIDSTADKTKRNSALPSYGCGFLLLMLLTTSAHKFGNKLSYPALGNM